MEKHIKAEKEKTGSWKYWLVSLVINAAILTLVMNLTTAFYETNDDFTIAYRIADAYPYVGFVNYFLCKLLIVIQKCFSSVNVFMLSQVAVALVAFTALLKTIMQRSRRITDSLLAIAVIFFFSFDHYTSIQFTKTSALLMAAGLIIVADTYINSRSFAGFAGGFLLYFVGVAYRQMGMFPAMAYICMFMLIFWIISGREFFSDKKPFREAVLFLLIAALLVAPYGIDKLSDKINAGTPERAVAREYQALRVKITDYPVYESYDSLREEYEAAGISKNDVYMIDRFVLDYDGGASLENLRTICKIYDSGAGSGMTVVKAAKKFARNIWKALKNRSFTGMHIILLAALGIYLICVLKPKNWSYIVLIALLTIALYIAIYYMQRTKYRAFYVADVSAAFWILYAVATAERRTAKTRLLEVLACLLVLASVFFMTQPAIKILNAKAAHNATLVEAPEHTEYFSEHPDLFYVMPTAVQKQPATYLDPFAIPIMPDNVTNTGGWETLTPARMDFLRSHGVENPIKDLIDNPDMFFFSKYKFEELTEYYNKWYAPEGKQIVFEKVDEAGETGIYTVRTVDLNG